MWSELLCGTFQLVLAELLSVTVEEKLELPAFKRVNRIKYFVWLLTVVVAQSPGVTHVNVLDVVLPR